MSMILRERAARHNSAGRQSIIRAGWMSSRFDRLAWPALRHVVEFVLC
jgi:hypothetical protein